MHATEFYESERALSEYLLFHYGSPAEILSWPFGPATALGYPGRCVSECLDVDRLRPNARALDLGCAVGRSSFELAIHCAQVLGIDFSRRFIEVAQQLKDRGSVHYRYVDEGELTIAAVASVPPGIDRTRVRFEQGDALALRPDIGEFDIVLLANLLDRLTDPRKCLHSLAKHVVSGGQLILTTPCTWMESYTPRAQWLGGVLDEGGPRRTLDSLQTILQPDFVLAQTRDLPFLIREHARKYQWSVALATVWVRR